MNNKWGAHFFWIFSVNNLGILSQKTNILYVAEKIENVLWIFKGTGKMQLIFQRKRCYPLQKKSSYRIKVQKYFTFVEKES